MDLITPDQAEALVEKGKPLRERTMAQSVEFDEPRVGKQTMLDRLGVLALTLFNLVVLAGFGWIVLRAVRSLL
jgi:hypothetical protein